MSDMGGGIGLADNLAPDPIWHRTQFGTKSVVGSIWHQECKRVNLAPDPIWHQECERSQFGTGVNLAPDQFGTKSAKESIWHRSQFGTGVNLAPESIWHHTNGTYFITLNMIQYKLWQNSQDMKETVPSSKFGNKGPVLKKFHPPLGP